MEKKPVSGKTVKTTTYNLLTPFKKNVKMVNERTTRKPIVKATPKPATKKTSNGSDTKPFNVRLIKPDEIIRDKPKAKPAPKGPKVGRAPKPKGLNDFLDKGKTPPSKNKKLPSDADVILKGYNDKKTIAKLKESKKKGKK